MAVICAACSRQFVKDITSYLMIFSHKIRLSSIPFFNKSLNKIQARCHESADSFPAGLRLRLRLDLQAGLQLGPQAALQLGPQAAKAWSAGSLSHTSVKMNPGPARHSLSEAAQAQPGKRRKTRSPSPPKIW